MKLKAVQLSLLSLIVLFLAVLSSEVTIDATDGHTSAAENEDLCIPKDLLHGKLSTCSSYQISTLNASPRRCMHIETLPPIDEDEIPSACTNYEKWSDGRNTCTPYERNKDWCNLYGGLDYSGHGVRYNANAACCACGGGNHQKPRLQVGDYVNVKYSPYDKCEHLRVAEYKLKPSFSYVVEATKDCGPNIAVMRNGRREVKRQIEMGQKFHVSGDSQDVIEKKWRVELKKCRVGLPQQEFEFLPADDKDLGKESLIIRHKLSGVNLSVALGGVTNEVNLTRVFDDGVFLGSEDFYHLQIITHLFKERLNRDGTPWSGPPRYERVTSGYFGEKEYSEVKSHDQSFSKKNVDEMQFSMWAFKPIENDFNESLASGDEHAEWLLRMTESIGIDYLDKLPPFHLLDVERDASKSEVKARFRELSKSFHPDKLVNQSEKKGLFEKIFVLLQNAYQGLKNANEAEKEAFRTQAESASQIFAHSQHVIELLPFHWTKIDDDDAGNQTNGRYILNVASHINSTFTNVTDEVELESSEQLWVTFMYSARCSMSRTVVGVVDLASRHLAQLGIKVGAYGCGLYNEFPTEKDDVLGIRTDPICAQFQRRETPNVHMVVETLPGKKRDPETGEIVTLPLDDELVNENAMFKYFYAAVPDGNTTQFLPQNFIHFAEEGKRVWENSHLVRKMRKDDFNSAAFISNMSIVAFLDGTGMGDVDHDVVSTIRSSFPGLARRFVDDDVYIGIAHCGFGDEYEDENDVISQRRVDCSKLDVSRLPDVKIYAHNETQGESLLRGHFGDRRDVQIALESMGNVIRMMIGGEDGDEGDLDEIDDLKEESNDGGSCGNGQPPPPPEYYDMDLDEIEGVEETPLLETNMDESSGDDTIKATPLPEAPKKPKLATSPEKREKIDRSSVRDRVAGFESRPQARRGGGKLLGGGGGGGGGFISG